MIYLDRKRHYVNASTDARRSLLVGRKLRTFLTTLAIVFGAWQIFGMNILMPTMLKVFKANMLARRVRWT